MRRVPDPNLFEEVRASEGLAREPEGRVRDCERGNMRVFVAQCCCSNISWRRTRERLVGVSAGPSYAPCYSSADPGGEDGVSTTSAATSYEFVCNAPRQHSGKIVSVSGSPRCGVWVARFTQLATHVSLRSANLSSPDVTQSTLHQG